MKEIGKYVGYALTLLTLIGWGVTIGVYKTKIEQMEQDMKRSNELWQEQIAINTKLETIVTLMLKDDKKDKDETDEDEN